MTTELTAQERVRVVSLIDERLRTFTCPRPNDDESEPAFTARVFVPQVQELLTELRIPGFTIAGEGVVVPTPTYLLGHRFFPDLAVSYYGERLVAYEAKFLRRGGRPNSISTALGQCLLYQLDRYPHVRGVLVECHRRVERDDLEHCASLFSHNQPGDRIDVIYIDPSVRLLARGDD